MILGYTENPQLNRIGNLKVLSKYLVELQGGIGEQIVLTAQETFKPTIWSNGKDGVKNS